jgi:hypothetical protein
MRSMFQRFVICAAVTACVLEIDPGAQAQTTSATPRSKFVDFVKSALLAHCDHVEGRIARY